MERQWTPILFDALPLSQTSQAVPFIGLFITCSTEWAGPSPFSPLPLRLSDPFFFALRQ